MTLVSRVDPKRIGTDDPVIEEDELLGAKDLGDLQIGKSESSSKRICRSIELVCQQVVQHIQDVDPCIVVAKMVLYCTVDKDDQVWVLWFESVQTKTKVCPTILVFLFLWQPNFQLTLMDDIDVDDIDG
jgi:hypothetical protein